MLRPGAVFAFSHYGAAERRARLPAALGGRAGHELLCPPEETREQVLTAGFEIVIFQDKTEEVLPDLRENRRRLEEHRAAAAGAADAHGRAGWGISDQRGPEWTRPRSGSEALVRKPA